jgi:hypothetical protein
MSTPTPRTDAEAGTLIDADEVVPAVFARTLERELHESRNAERLARVQLGNERAWLDELISVNATGAARLAHATAQLAAEREKSERYRLAALKQDAALSTEREKVGALRLACERIVEQWDKNHIAAPFHASSVMYSWASTALATTEDTP